MSVRGLWDYQRDYGEPLFGWPADKRACIRSWRSFNVFWKPLGSWAYRFRMYFIVRRCGQCQRRFRFWEMVTYVRGAGPRCESCAPEIQARWREIRARYKSGRPPASTL